MRGAGSLVLVAAAIGLPGFRDGHAHELTQSATLAGVCESRTVNYITHTLPQQCLRTNWSSGNATSQINGTQAAATQTSQAGPEQTTVNGTDTGEKKEKSAQDGDKQGQEKEVGKDEDGDNQDLATSSFMSFEEWKALQLKKHGQDLADMQARKKQERKSDSFQASSNGALDSLGDDSEIALDFEVLSEKVSELTSSANSAPGAQETEAITEDAVVYDDGKSKYLLSRDAGRTCKERFSFSSFDGGGQVLKSNPGVKNAKAILVENKDSYMLLECARENKFVIVELSEDILVDTVVLANYEFFSSMIRKFRVSVSAKYPVKIDKWKDLGTFEARNSRDIQAFLVQDPQIWAKYIRVEFLTHYGNEYYCPVSLLRVHGMRMLDSWKESEGGQDDEDETIDPPPEEEVIEPSGTPDSEPAQVDIPLQGNSDVYVSEVGLSPWHPLFPTSDMKQTCSIASPLVAEPTEVSSSSEMREIAPATTSEGSSTATTSSKVSVTSEPVQTHLPSTVNTTDSASLPSPLPANASLADPGRAVYGNNTTSSEPASSSSLSDPVSKVSPPESSSTNQTISRPPVVKPPVPKPPSNSAVPKASGSPTQTKNRTSSAGVPAASPTVQESFFKTVTKRLQHLESNTSLSLQYIEDQSRFLQEALLKMEKRQISRVDSFLNTLNNTVFSELRNVRQQYDQIWQSTVIALETQREQSQREIVALSDRLGVLADEVVFQKRMAILQSVLLLSCLVLVIFSRGLVGTTLESVSWQGGAASAGLLSPTPSANHVSYSDSPSPSPLRSSGAAGNRPRGLSRSQSYPDKVLPMTPTSDYGREATPPSIHVNEARSSYFDLDGDFPTKPSRSQLGDELALEKDLSQGTSNDENDKSDSGVGEEDHNEETQLPTARSSISQKAGTSVRKPLPALPEDPT